MIVGFGIDVVEIERVRRQLADPTPGTRADRFLRRCFTAGERAYCEGRRDRATHYAARFAAKEAALKALGVPAGVRLTDLEVTRDRGAPALQLRGAAARAAGALGVSRIHLTIAHDGGLAAAGVVLEGPR